MKNRTFSHASFFFALLLSLLTSCSEKNPDNDQNTQIELEQILIVHSLDPWYPRVLDTINGGYYSTFSFDWKKEPNQNKFIVTQARHIWSLSNAFEFYPERTIYADYANHGFQFLKDKMWDGQYGGFYEITDSLGVVLQRDHAFEKRAYGNAFAIYALAEYYKISNKPEALAMATEAFQWLDTHARDGHYGGYFQFLERDGSPIPRSALTEGYDAGDKAFVGFKDYNSSIHILEAFTGLYQVWPDSVLRLRLEEMFYVVSDTMMDSRGFLKLYFYPDWTLVTDDEFMVSAGEGHTFANHITFGHDVETAYLLLEAAEALGLDHNLILPKAKHIVDHALKNGWDNEKGGFYEQGKYVDGKIVILDNGKNWWAQAEGLNTLILLSAYFPEDPQHYKEKAELLLQYINDNLIDHEYTGWYAVGADKFPDIRKSSKATIWKGNYHTSRSLTNCIHMISK